MPLGTREVLLIIRARDQATRLIADVGRAFSDLDAQAKVSAMSSIRAGAAVAGVGIGLATVGAAGLAFFKSATSSAIDYNRASALTLTQVDQLGVSLETVKKIGRDVATAIPAPFEQMQSSLYDIFSSMDVNVTQAQGLLTGFAKASVAGQTDVQTAGRATISIMNAFKIPAEDVNKVLDVQFETVRKGVLTYAEFASTVGRAIPSAERAGQSIQTVGAMMAFLTRNGLSAAQAATASARSFDLLSNPKFAARMHDMGIEVFDAAGNFRPMVDVVTELRGKLSTMTPEAATKALADLTKGAGGTIQAMRFLNLAVHDQNGLFNSLFTDISGAQGSMQAAYDIMFNQPASQAQLFSNNLEVLKTLIGDVFLPMLNRVLSVGIAVLKWFNDMDPATRKWIVRISALGFALLFLNGIVLIVVGLIMVLSGVMELMGGSLAMLVGKVLAGNILVAGFALAVWGLVKAFQALRDNDVVGYIVGIVAVLGGLLTAAIAATSIMGEMGMGAAAVAVLFDPLTYIILAVVAAVAALAYVIYNNWDTIKAATAATWGFIQDQLQTVWGWMQTVWGWLSTAGPAVWFGLRDAVVVTWSAIVAIIQTAGNVITTVVGAIIGFFQMLWGHLVDFYNWFADRFGTGFMDIIHALGGLFSTVIPAIGATITSLWSRLMWFWSGFTTVFIPVFDVFKDSVVGAFNIVWGQISNYTSMIVGFIEGNFIPIWWVIIDLIQFVASEFTLWWNVMTTMVGVAIDIIVTVIQTGVGIIQALWNAFGATLLSVIIDAWNLISGIVATAITLIKDIIMVFLSLIQGNWGQAWDYIKRIFTDAWNGIWNALQAVWGLMWDFFISLPGNIIQAIGSVGSLLWDAGWHILHSMYEGVLTVFYDIANWFSGLPGQILSFVGDLGSVLWDAGKRLIGGFIDGIKSMIGSVKDTLGSIASDAVSWKGPPAYDAKVLVGNGQLMMQGFLDGLKNGYTDVEDFLKSVAPNMSGSSAFNVTAGGGSAPGSGGPGGGGPTMIIQSGAFEFKGSPEENAAAVKQVLEELIKEMATR